MRQLLVLILMCLLAAGCASPTRNIADAATVAGNTAGEIKETAASSETRFDAIAKTVDEPEIQDTAEAGAEEQRDIQVKAEAIQGAADTVHAELPGTEDKAGFFDRLGNLAMRFLWAVILIGGIIVLWRTGAFYLLKRLAWALGWFICVPKPAMSAARVDMEAMNVDSRTTAREAVAIKRSNDAGYDAAFKRIQKRQKELPS